MRQKLEIRDQKTGNINRRAVASRRIESTTSLPFVICAFLLAAIVLASGCATTTSVQEQRQIATLTAIDITDNTLNINVDKPFKYTIYKPSDPYKAIVELPDVRLGIAAGKIKSEKAGITEVIPSQTDAPPLTKLEILLSSPAGIMPAYKGTLLTLNIINLEEELKVKTTEKASETPKAEEKTQEVKTPVEKAEEPALPKAAAPKELSPATSILKVNIEKEQDVLKLTIKGDGALKPNVFELDNRTVLDMPNVTLDAPLPKAQSPLKGIRVGKYKDKTRIVLDMREKTSFTVTSIEDSVIVAFQLSEKEKYAAKTSEGETKVAEGAMKNSAASAEKPAEVGDSTLREGKYKGQKISLDFQDADIGPIFRLLADISGYNFVIDPAAKGKITLKLMNVPWEQALDIILQTHGLAKQQEGNIIWIAPIATFTKISKEKTEAKASEEIAEELVQEIVRINYATASEISTAITNAKIISKDRGSITMDNRMNTLIIKDTQKNINKIKALVKIMDVAKSQVMIEAKLVTVSSDYTEKLGIRWGGTIGTPPTGIGIGEIKSGTFSVNTPIVTAGAAATNPGGVLGLSLGSASTVQVNLSLSALESINKARTLSNPKILTMDNEAANIQQGQTFFVQTTSAEGTKTEEKQATLSLNVTPKITPDGYVQLKVTATDNSLTSVTPPVMDTKTINTNALVKNGETLVLGGIYTTTTTEGEEGIPLLSRIPILGWLFKTKTQSGPNVKELLIFITPTIVTKP
ncbi:MAG: type IV pilus secretin PilQ [Thermodesulfovibrionales bacterium]|nr:type IV pilus secretin PilQ [Thermodesulfovibrionales bacterium]